MSTVTTRLGLVKPAGLEQFSRATYNNNLDLIDAAGILIAQANSSYNTNNVAATNSRFTRLATGTTGIIVAEFAIDFDNAGGIVIAANTAASTSLPSLVPAGFRPATVTHSFPLVGTSMVKNGGQGQTISFGINTSGDFLMNSTGVAYTAPTGSDMNAFFVYRWDGNP